MPHSRVQSAPPTGTGAMFDLIADRYDLLNRLMSFGLDRGWRKKLVQSVADHARGRVLDVATGTADVAISLAMTFPEMHVVGLDPSSNMLAQGQRKIDEHNLGNRISLREGNVLDLPFESGVFGACCIAFGIRNVPDRLQGLREMTRVTQSGGRVVVLELSEPEGGGLSTLARFHVHNVVPWLGGLISGSREYRYLQQSIAAFPPAREFTQMMEEAGLKVVQCQRLSFGAAHLFVGEREQV